MNRKEFIRNTLFGIASCFLPNIKEAETVKDIYIDFQALPLIPTKLDSAISAQIKLQRIVELNNPPGVYIDLACLRNTSSKLRDNDIKKVLEKLNKMYEKSKIKAINETGA